MRILSVILLVLSIAFSDVVSGIIFFDGETVSLMDTTCENETESEQEKEIDGKKESKYRVGNHFLLNHSEMHSALYALIENGEKLNTPYQEIHSPPPEA
ncbi:hypothetical protein [Portibacter marinus]|uniref:hypothetical protein n=1 Tax=Portibacter marinus TaxID=2898660 RepID=UPI001F1BD318|nr:hypothetical protein [Portibacter marinus]